MLDFKSFNSSFDFVIGVESAFVDASENIALDFVKRIKAFPLLTSPLRGFDKKSILSGKNRRTKVRAFASASMLYVLRTDMETGETRIFEYHAPHGLLLSEACAIAEWHHKTHVDF